MRRRFRKRAEEEWDYDKTMKWLDEHEDEIRNLYKKFTRKRIKDWIYIHIEQNFEFEGTFIHNCVSDEWVKPLELEYYIEVEFPELGNSEVGREEGFTYFKKMLKEKFNIYGNIYNNSHGDVFALQDWFDESRIWFVSSQIVFDVMIDVLKTKYKYMIELYDIEGNCLKQVGVFRSIAEAEERIDNGYINLEGVDSYDILEIPEDLYIDFIY